MTDRDVTRLVLAGAEQLLMPPMSPALREIIEAAKAAEQSRLSLAMTLSGRTVKATCGGVSIILAELSCDPARHSEQAEREIKDAWDRAAKEVGSPATIRELIDRMK